MHREHLSCRRSGGAARLDRWLKRLAFGAALTMAGVAQVSIGAAQAASEPDVAGQPVPFGAVASHGSLAGLHLAAPVVGMAATPDGGGYWLVASDGGVFAFGDARFFGSLGGIRLSEPVVGMAATPDGGGYWLVASDGGVFAFGDARFFGSLGGIRLSEPVVGMAAAPDGGGYWLVASDGGVFAFGDARFFGSLGGIRLSEPVVAMAAPDAGGYWLAAADGGVFSFGDARFEGSVPGQLPPGRSLDAPVVAMAATGAGGYWLAGSDGGVFSFGDASYYGSLAGQASTNPVAAIATDDAANGYWLLPTSPPPVPVCTVADLRISATAPIGSAGALHYQIVFQNISSASCSLDGFPGVSFRASSGNQIGPPAVEGTAEAPQVVNLAPGASGYARLDVTDPGIPPCAGPGTVGRIIVYPPGSSSAANVVPPTGMQVCVSPNSANYTDSTIGPVTATSAY